MSHLNHETLWALGRVELNSSEAQAAQEHLAQCPECRASFQDVQLAQQVLVQLPEVSPMPEPLARRVGLRLADAADARAARRLTAWWPAFFTLRSLAAAGALVFLAAGVWFLAWRTPEATLSPIAAAPSPPSNQPEIVGKKLKVSIASAKKATVRRLEELAEGATVSTQRGGSVWMKLPDGSRAALTAASEVTLARLEEKRLTLDLARGSVALVVPHREDRLLVVRAGEVQVRDRGTRFLVSRQPGRTLVAVDEGMVEVETPKGSREVRANHAVAWSNGQLTELNWEPSPPAPPPPTSGPPPPVPEPTQTAGPQPEPEPESGARLVEETEAGEIDGEENAGEESEEEENEAEEGGPPPLEGVVQTPTEPLDSSSAPTDEGWAAYPSAPVQPKVPVRGSRERRFSLRNLERMLRELGTVISSGSRREAMAHQVTLTADANDCQYALILADRWLREPVTMAPNEPRLRRGVQLQQVRCLNHLGRVEEAETLRRQLEGPP